MTSGDGSQLAHFMKDPIQSVRFSIEMDDKPNGLELATKVHHYYFGNVTNADEIPHRFKQVWLYISSLFNLDGFVSTVYGNISKGCKYYVLHTWYL